MSHASIDEPRESSAAPRFFALVHALQIPLFAAALVTGLMLFLPALREALTSGYSTTIGDVHRWSGRMQILLVAAMVITWGWLMLTLRPAQEANHRWRAWRLTHILVVTAMAVGLAASGVVLSSRRSFPLTIVDYSLTTHLLFTTLSFGIVAVHAVLALANPQRRLFIAPAEHRAASDTRSRAVDGQAN